MRNDYDVLIIGAGPGGIFSAYELMQKRPGWKIAVLEAGNSLDKRKCPIDGDKIKSCIGCKTCMTACPYPGVRTYIDGEPQYVLDFAVGDAQAPAHKANSVEKCTFCAHRVDRGEKPACVAACRYKARTFGDLDDPSSDISKLLASREYTQLEAEVDTGSCFFLLK